MNFTKTNRFQICTLTQINKLFGLEQIKQHVKKKEKRKKAKKTKCVDLHNVLDVNINEKLANDIYSLLEDLQIKPTVNVSLQLPVTNMFLLYINLTVKITFQKNTGIMYKDKTLILNQVSEPFEKCNEFIGIKMIPWGPPQSNWNPWSAVRISNPVSLFYIICLNVYLFKLK